MTNETEEKKGFFGALFKPKRKIIGNYQLQDLINNNSIAIKTIGEEMQLLKEAVLKEVTATNTLFNEIKKLRSKLTEEQQKEVYEIRKLLPELKATDEEISLIIQATKDYLFSQKNLEALWDRTKSHIDLSKFQKEEVCYKCGKPIQEGEYYLIKGRKACLTHLEGEPAIKEHKEETKKKIIQNIKKIKPKKERVQDADQENYL